MAPSRSATLIRRRRVRHGFKFYVALSAVFLSSVLVVVPQYRRYVKLHHRAVIIGDKRPVAVVASSATGRPARTKRKRRKQRKPSLIHEAIKQQKQRQRQQQQYYNFADIVLQNRLVRPFRRLSTTTAAAALPALPPSNRSESWCQPHSTDHRSKNGLLFNKTPKAASSTVSGIALRIAQRYALRYYPNTTDVTDTVPCNSRVGHVPGYKAGKAFGDRDVDRSYLFSILRDPAQRSLSRVYFSKVSQDGKNATDANVLSWLRKSTNSQFGAVSPGMGGFQLAYLSLGRIEEWSAWTMNETTMVKDANSVHENVRRVMMEYDLIMLVERFDESLVAMQLLLGLDVGDILYLSSKHAGDYYYSPGAGNCIKLAKTRTSARVGRYLRSHEWYAKSYGDYVLHEAASQSLDMTIDMVLGRERFDEALRRFLQLRKVAEAKCAAEAIFPCSPDGVEQQELSSASCYRNDWGCGGPCLDAIRTG